MTQQQNIIHAHILYNSISILCSLNEIEINKYYIATIRTSEKAMDSKLKEERKVVFLYFLVFLIFHYKYENC